jgi:predicted RND superfamily exporter protein
LSQGQMTIRLKWLEATSYRDLTEYVQKGIDAYLPKTAKIATTGAVYTLISTIGQLIRDLIKSFGFSMIVITIIMMFLLKGLKLGFISMIPNLTPILWLLGLMGFVGIPIDMNNILIASIAIGIAVDDTIHYLHHFRVTYEVHKDPFLAIHHSFRHSARAMVSTSVILMLGFFVYMTSSMNNLKVFGLLIGLSSGLALFVDLTLGPALVRTFYKRPNYQEFQHIKSQSGENENNKS